MKPPPRSEAAPPVANYPAGKPKKAATAVAAAPAQVAEAPRGSILSKLVMFAMWTVIVFGAGGAFGFGIYYYLESQRQAQKNGEGDSYAQASSRPEARPAQPAREKASRGNDAPPRRKDNPLARTEPPATKPPVEEEPTPRRRPPPIRVPDSLPDSTPRPNPPPSTNPPPRPAPSPRTEAAWTEYTSKEGGFTVRLPAGEVMHQDKPVKAPVGKLTIHIHGTLPGNEEYFITVFYDYPQSAMGAGADILLEGAKTGLKAFTKGAKITKETKIKYGDHPGREWTIIDMAGKGSMKSRVYLVKNRLIQLAVGSGIGKVADKDVQTFFESFKLTGK
ncbi:MAG TPA: hypothetical protein VMG10_09630 [Gemmataceae bacterium]|nr:hypothetical protein [Gemmataceae bacterium]